MVVQRTSRSIISVPREASVMFHLLYFGTGMIFIISIRILYDFTCFYYLRMPVAVLQKGINVYECEWKHTADGNRMVSEHEDAKA